MAWTVQPVGVRVQFEQTLFLGAGFASQAGEGSWIAAIDGDERLGHDLQDRGGVLAPPSMANAWFRRGSALH